MPYRDPANANKPTSPDVDPRLFAVRWWQPVLVLATLYTPVLLALTWFGDPTVRCGGPARPETLAEKIAFTVVTLLSVVGLLYARHRHHRRLRAVLAALEAPAAHVRIDVGAGAGPERSDDASDEASEDAGESRRGRFDPRA